MFHVQPSQKVGEKANPREGLRHRKEGKSAMLRTLRRALWRGPRPQTRGFFGGRPWHAPAEQKETDTELLLYSDLKPWQVRVYSLLSTANVGLCAWFIEGTNTPGHYIETISVRTRDLALRWRFSASYFSSRVISRKRSTSPYPLPSAPVVRYTDRIWLGDWSCHNICDESQTPPEQRRTGP
jgi:hypothetical protein